MSAGRAIGEYGLVDQAEPEIGLVEVGELAPSVPVAELVPELARSVGILDASTVYGGYRLIAQDGRRLANVASRALDSFPTSHRASHG